MSEFIRIPPDSTGKRLRHRQLTDIYLSVDNNIPIEGATIHGVTSGAQGVLVGRTHHGTEIEYFLKDVTGTFQTGETLNNGIATTYGVIDTIVPDVFTPVVSIADPSNPDRVLAIDANGAELISFAEGQPAMAGFGSVKVSNHRALGVYESSVDSYDDLFYVQEVTGGTSTYDAVASSHVLATTSSINSKVVRTTNRYHYYLPGTSNLIYITSACGDTGKAGNVRRWGAYDDDDGVFFELYGTTFNVVVRSSVSGSVVETKIPSTQFDVLNTPFADEFNADFDITKVHVWWIDFQWLGAGRIRFGYHLPTGQRVVLHTIENAGQNPVPYMRTGTLPLRTENFNYGAAGASSELREVCMAVYCEGNFDDYTFWRHCGGVIPATVDTDDDLLVAYRMANPTINGKHNSIQAYPESITVFTDQPLAVTLWQGAVLSGSDTWTAVNNSQLERLPNAAFTGTMTLTNATPVVTFLCGVGVTRIDTTGQFEINDEGIMVNADGTPEIWAIAARKLGTNATVQTNMTFKELW